ncbi:MAG: 30S ribosomal protein S20 [Rubrobacter sp.]|jgi:small subunit ribosomal protein S20|nr:30S ribosomal protein S20 [Rubrobacter sp.]
MPAPSKRDKQALRKYTLNRGVRTRLRNLSKDFYKAIDAGDYERAEKIRNDSQKQFSRAANKGIIHHNRADRSISRFDKALAGTKGES